MLISKTSRYGLQAATDLAERFEGGEAAQAGEIAKRTGIPKNYLSKILHQLAREGVVISERGPRGGFRLARDPYEVSLAEIIEPVDPSLSERHCLLGRPTCSDRNPCQAHNSWRRIYEELHSFLDETSIADLAQDK